VDATGTGTAADPAVENPFFRYLGSGTSNNPEGDYGYSSAPREDRFSSDFALCFANMHCYSMRLYNSLFNTSNNARQINRYRLHGKQQIAGKTKGGMKLGGSVHDVGRRDPVIVEKSRLP
jgi:hypothetical protein